MQPTEADPALWPRSASPVSGVVELWIEYESSSVSDAGIVVQAPPADAIVRSQHRWTFRTAGSGALVLTSAPGIFPAVSFSAERAKPGSTFVPIIEQSYDGQWILRDQAGFVVGILELTYPKVQFSLYDTKTYRSTNFAGTAKHIPRPAGAPSYSSGTTL